MQRCHGGQRRGPSTLGVRLARLEVVFVEGADGSQTGQGRHRLQQSDNQVKALNNGPSCTIVHCRCETSDWQIARLQKENMCRRTCHRVTHHGNRMLLLSVEYKATTLDEPRYGRTLAQRWLKSTPLIPRSRLLLASPRRSDSCGLKRPRCPTWSNHVSPNRPPSLKRRQRKMHMLNSVEKAVCEMEMLLEMICNWPGPSQPISLEYSRRTTSLQKARFRQVPIARVQR